MGVALTEARRIVEKASQKARELGARMAFAILDDAGHVVLVERMDGAAWITADIAVGKAYTAVAFRLIGERFTDSGQIGAYFNDTPSFLGGLGVVTMGKIIGRGGGIPIVRDGKVLGGFGISGGTASQDHECAKAGLEAL